MIAQRRRAEGAMNARGSRSINIGLRNVVLTILIGLGLVFIWQIRGTLMLTFAAVILVVLFTMPVRLLVKRFRMNRAAAIVVSVIGFFIILGVLGVPILSTIGTQSQVLAERVQQGINELRVTVTRESLVSQFSFLEGFLDVIFPVGEGSQPSNDVIGQVVSQVTDALGRLGGTVLPVVGGVANTILSTLLIFFLSMYLLAEPELYVNGIIKLTPIWYRERMWAVLKRLDSTLRAWLSVTGVSMILVAILTGLGLALLGIREWLALGVLAGYSVVHPQLWSLGGAGAVGCGGDSGDAGSRAMGRGHYLRRVVLSEPGSQPGAGQRAHEYAGDFDLAGADHIWFLLRFSGIDAGGAPQRLRRGAGR